MKHTAIILLLASTALACSSGSNVKVIRPEVELVQLVGPGDVAMGSGIMQIQFGLRVSNRASEPITLRRVEMSSVGRGAYVLRREFHPFNKVIRPEQYEDVTFWSRGFVYGSRFEPSNEPVTVRAILFFESPDGPFQQIVQRNLDQFGGPTRGQ
jgi:hypothetical protein